MSALDKQEGGFHYKDYPIQPVEFITKNKLGFLEGCVIKRVCRWRAKNGIEDLRKAIHELELLIEMEEAGKDVKSPASEPVQAADESLPRYQVPDGGMWPYHAPNGTVVEALRPIPGPDHGCRFERVGFMWDGALVRDDGPR